MISAGDFRNGVTLEIDGQVVQILEFQHVKPGKGAAFVRTKLKNVINGGVVERTFRPTEKFPAARIDRVDMQYLYADGELFNFMNQETYDQVALNKDIIGDALKFVKENEVCKVVSYIFRGASPVCRVRDYRDRARIQGRYGTGRQQACNRGNRCNRIRTFIRGDWRQD